MRNSSAIATLLRGRRQCGSAYATGAAANNKQIKIKLGHDPKVKRAARTDKSKLLIGYIHSADAWGETLLRAGEHSVLRTENPK